MVSVGRELLEERILVKTEILSKLIKIHIVTARFF